MEPFVMEPPNYLPPLNVVLSEKTKKIRLQHLRDIIQNHKIKSHVLYDDKRKYYFDSHKKVIKENVEENMI